MRPLSTNVYRVILTDRTNNQTVIRNVVAKDWNNVSELIEKHYPKSRILYICKVFDLHDVTNTGLYEVISEDAETDAIATDTLSNTSVDSV